MAERIRVTIWNEFHHEQHHEGIKKLYPKGMHGAIKKGLRDQGEFTIKTATLEEPEHGLTEKVLEKTDVLLWWGHCRHNDVEDEIAARVQRHVLEGMGLIVLHSGHFSKPFKRLMGTNCSLIWREIGEKERLWNVARGHPITEGIGEYFELPNTEMYGERFDIPEPDQLIFISWFEGGEVFRSGAVFNRGHGRVFYFRPGHETYPIYYNEDVLRVLGNACRWLEPVVRIPDSCSNSKPLEDVEEKENEFGKAGIQQGKKKAKKKSSKKK